MGDFFLCSDILEGKDLNCFYSYSCLEAPVVMFFVCLCFLPVQHNINKNSLHISGADEEWFSAEVGDNGAVALDNVFNTTQLAAEVPQAEFLTQTQPYSLFAGDEGAPSAPMAYAVTLDGKRIGLI